MHVTVHSKAVYAFQMNCSSYELSSTFESFIFAHFDISTHYHINRKFWIVFATCEKNSREPHKYIQNCQRSRSVQLLRQRSIFHADSKPSVKHTCTRKRICITVWQPHYIRRTRRMNTFVLLQPQRFIIIGWNLRSFSRHYNYGFGLSVYFNAPHT